MVNSSTVCHGPLAQLVERLHGMQEVTGSSPVRSTIGKNIKRYRQEKGLSQDKLSKLSDLSLNTVVKIELDDTPNPTIETMQRIAKALVVSVDDLLRK